MLVSARAGGVARRERRPGLGADHQPDDEGREAERAVDPRGQDRQRDPHGEELEEDEGADRREDAPERGLRMRWTVHAATVRIVRGAIQSKFPRVALRKNDWIVGASERTVRS